MGGTQCPTGEGAMSHDAAASHDTSVEAELPETDPSITTASHDLPVPERLAEFMRTGWAEPGAAELRPLPSAPYTAARRVRLAARFPGETLVIPSGGAKVRNNDCSFEF